jgi:chemotaxis protein CheC
MDMDCDIMEINIVSEMDRDALSEAGNIAAASAANALSKLIGERVNLKITECNIIMIDRIPYAFGDQTSQIVAVNMLIPTRNLCTVLMFLSVDSALEYCDKFSKNLIGTSKEISYNEIVVLTELGNICICAYLNALSKLLDIKYVPTPPAVACDTIESILVDVAVNADAIDNKAILLETEFVHDTGNFKGEFLFIPDRDSKEAILKVFKTKGEFKKIINPDNSI